MTIAAGIGPQSPWSRVQRLNHSATRSTTCLAGDTPLKRIGGPGNDSNGTRTRPSPPIQTEQRGHTGTMAGLEPYQTGGGEGGVEGCVCVCVCVCVWLETFVIVHEPASWKNTYQYCRVILMSDNLIHFIPEWHSQSLNITKLETVWHPSPLPPNKKRKKKEN